MVREQIISMKVKDLLGKQVKYKHPSFANRRTGVIERICQEHLVILGKDKILRPCFFRDIYLL